MVIQFPDLTEVMYGYELVQISPSFSQTEFAFQLKSPVAGTSDRMYKEAGFKAVSIMNNWWPSHAGEIRPLTLYWMRATEVKPLTQGPNRLNWKYNSTGKWAILEQHMAGSGCGLKIGELPFRKSLFHRYFTLMRLPVEITPLQKKWLAMYNFRHLDTGKLASYYVNGWKPEEYTSAKEFEYFKTTQKGWRETGMKGYD